MASPEQHQNGEENEKGKRGATLGENQGIDGIDLVKAGQAAGEGGAAEGGGDAPEECGGGDVDVAADGLAVRFAQAGRLQQTAAEPSLGRTAEGGCPHVVRATRNIAHVGRLQQKLAELCSAGQPGAAAPRVLSSAVVGFGLGVDQDAEQFRKFLLEADFEFGGNVVHAG